MDDTFITIRVRRDDLADLDQLVAHVSRSYAADAKLTRSGGFKEAVRAYAASLGVTLAPREPESK